MDTSVPAGVADIDRDIFIAQNKVRANPKCLVPILEERLSWFESDSKILAQPGKKRFRTFEGPASVQEAINFLNS